MKNKNKNLLYGIVFIIICLAFISYYFALSKRNTDNQDNNSQQSAIANNNFSIYNTKTEAKDNILNYQGKIYFTRSTNDIFEIYYKSSNAAEKLLFTDQDENEKVKSLVSMTENGKLLAIMAPKDQVFGGKLYLISSDGSGKKEKIIDNFISPQPPVISPDESKIAYILFSNAEFEYGFSLYLMNLSGENKVKIDNDATTVSFPVFSLNSKNIAYLKGKAITISDLDGNNKSSIYTIPDDLTLTSITWNMQDKILITCKKINEDKSKIISIDPGSKNNKILYESIGNLVNPIWINIEKDKIALINSTNSTLDIINLNNIKENLTKATNLIKWQK